MARNSENVSAAVEAVNGIIADQATALTALKKKVAEKAVPEPDISMGLTGATVGSIIKVKAVDTEGKPTAWETMKLAPEEWTFTLDDESTVTKTVLVAGA